MSGKLSLGPVIAEGSYGKIRAGSYAGKSVAVKVIAKASTESKFLPRELEAMMNLKNENIIEVYEVIETSKEVYIVMEMATGDLLEQIMEQGPLSEAEAKKIFSAVVKAIEYCHSKNVAHRDLKLENILLNASGEAKVTDFGFCSSADLSSTFCGSMVYAAPEIMQAVSYEPIKADMYSLGVILYALVCGKLPINMSFPASVSAECQKLIEQLLECNVEKRATVAEVLSSAFLN